MGKKLVIACFILNTLLILGFCITFYLSLQQEENNIGVVVSALMILTLSIFLSMWARGLWRWYYREDEDDNL